MKSPGVEVRPIMNMAGTHEFNEVFFDDVQVPKTNLVGEQDRGWYVAVTLLDFERSGIEYAATSLRLLDDLTAFIKESRGEMEGWVADLLTERYVEAEVARLMAYRVAWMQSQGMVPNGKPQ